MIDSNNRVYKILDNFLMEYVFVSGAHTINAVKNIGGGLSSPMDSDVDDIIRSLFYMRLVSILNESLDWYIKNNNLLDNSQSCKSLFDMINILENKRKLDNCNELHKIRGYRNDIGHKDNFVVTKEMFEDAVKIITDTLKELSLITYVPNYELTHVNREGFRKSDKECEKGYFVFNYGVTEKQTGRSKICSWKETILQD